MFTRVNGSVTRGEGGPLDTTWLRHAARRLQPCTCHVMRDEAGQGKSNRTTESYGQQLFFFTPRDVIAHGRPARLRHLVEGLRQQ